MLTALLPYINARLFGRHAHPLTHPWLVTRWLARNAQVDTDGRMQALLTEINSFNASPRLSAASLAAFLQVDVVASRGIGELIETYLAGNRAANKAVLRKLEDASRWFGATYELFYRAHRAGKPAIKSRENLALVLLGMLRYRNLHNRIRLFRYDDPPGALWQVANSIYRYAVAEGINRLPVSAPHRDRKPVTVEGEYANLLMLARLSTGSFTAQEIEFASVLLSECAERLRLEADEAAHATFALDPDSLTGLVSAHGFRLTSRTVFLDPEPLADESGDALQRRVKVAWLERLGAHWVPDRKVISRRAERELVDIPVALVPGLHNIHRELLAEMENAGEFWDTLIRSGRWKIVESSNLDCRIQFENESADQFPVGALISMRREGAPDWQVGVVRRIKRYEGSRTELGVELIAREVRAFRLWPGNPAEQPANGGKGPEIAPLVVLYLPSTGAIPPAPARSVILRHSDYNVGQALVHVGSDSRAIVRLRDAIEIGRGWVWAPFTVESRTPLREGDLPGETRQGLTTQSRDK